MSLPLPGWYPDPARSAPLRWWDGQAWTTQVHRAPAPANYVRRVRAYLLDALILWTFSWIVLSPFHRTFADEVTGIITSNILTGDGTFPSLGVLWDYGLPQMWLVNAIPGVIVRVAYDVFLATRRGASVGQGAVGLRVVQDATPGRLDGIDWRSALVRSLVLRVLAPTCLGWLVVVCWPWFDPQRRSLADVLARTRVVDDPARVWQP